MKFFLIFCLENPLDFLTNKLENKFILNFNL